MMMTMLDHPLIAFASASVRCIDDALLLTDYCLLAAAAANDDDDEND